MSLASPAILAVGVLVAAVALLSSLRQERRRRRLAAFLGGPAATHRSARSDLSRLRLERVGALPLAALAVAIGAAGPGGGDAPPPPTDPVTEPTTVVLALDVSASMQASDVAPRRLARAVQVADGLVARLDGARVGLLLFASETYWLAEPTADRDAVRFFLAGLDASVTSAQDPGSVLSRGIDEAVTSLSDTTGTLAVVLLTDGESREPSGALAAALERATASGVQIHAVGVGSSTGAEVAIPRSAFQVGGPVTTEDGSPAISRLDPTRLRSIADRTGGTYGSADDPGASERLARLIRGTPLPTAPTDEARSREGVAATLLALAALVILLGEGTVEAADRRGLLRSAGWRGDAR